MNPPSFVAHYKIVSKLGAGGMVLDFAASAGTSGYMSGKPSSVPSRPVWLDQAGKIQPAPYGGAISPDGKLVAVSRGGIAAANMQVWDTNREVLTSITSNGQDNGGPV